MESDNLIGSIWRQGKVYYVKHRGSDLIGRESPRLKRSEVDHSIMRNDAQALLGYPYGWKTEVPIRKNDEVFIVADAAYSRNGRIYFVEIDNRATMRTNNAKIKRYAEVFGLIDQPASLIWYTLIESRKELLAKSCEKAGIPYQMLKGGG